MLDRENKGVISEREVRFLFQVVYDDFFLYCWWFKFFCSCVVFGFGISFVEIEVLFCDMLIMDWLDEERQDEDNEKEEELRCKWEKERVDEEVRKVVENKVKFEKEVVKRKEEVVRRRVDVEVVKKKVE